MFNIYVQWKPGVENMIVYIYMDWVRGLKFQRVDSYVDGKRSADSPVHEKW